MSFRATESLALQIAQHVGGQIVSGDLVEGERIQEMRIAAELQVSRGSVREALLILQRRHLVEIFPRRGAVVAELSPHMIKGLYEVVVLLFSLIVRKTAEVWRQDDLTPFIDGINELQSVVQSRDIEGFYNGSFDILRRAQHFANNPFLDDMLDDLQPSMQRSFYLALQVNRRELDESYAFLKGVLDAVMLRQGDRAAELVEEFCLHQRNLVLESLLRVKQIEMAWARRQRR